MKPPATEREQIGTAAIDLFASGMGAFILIAVIFMVLFAATPKQEKPDTPEAAPVPCPEPRPCPETPECPECPPPVSCPEAPEPACPVCPEVEQPACPETPPCPTVTPVVCPEKPECPVCPVCPEPVEPEPAPTPAPAPPVPEQACPEPKPQTSLLPETDLVFVLDTTGSMRAEIESLKRELHILVGVLERMMPSVGIGVVTFNDRLQRPPGRHFPLRGLTNDEDAIRDINRFLRSISITDAKGPNDDIPEAVLIALNAAVNTSFRPHVPHRIIIVITDAYAYADEQAKTLQIARSFARAEGQRISAVHVRQNPDSEKYLALLAEAGGGEFVPDRGSILANVLMGIL